MQRLDGAAEKRGLWQQTNRSRNCTSGSHRSGATYIVLPPSRVSPWRAISPPRQRGPQIWSEHISRPLSTSSRGTVVLTGMYNMGIVPMDLPLDTGACASTVRPRTALRTTISSLSFSNIQAPRSRLTEGGRIHPETSTPYLSTWRSNTSALPDESGERQLRSLGGMKRVMLVAQL